jgi:predicted kinase
MRADRQDGEVLLVVISGQIASGKSTLAKALASELRRRGTPAAAVELDVVYEMLDPVRGPKTNQATWKEARRLAGRIACALLAEGTRVVLDGEFLTSADRADLLEVLPPDVQPRFVALRVPYDTALQRARIDPTRGVSRDPEFLRDHYEATAPAVLAAPFSDLALDTGQAGIEESVRAVIEWMSLQEA